MKKLAVLIVLSFICSVFIGYVEDTVVSAQNEKPAWKTEQKGSENRYDFSTILVKFKERVTKKQRTNIASLVRGTFKDKNNDGIDDRFEHIMSGQLALIKLQGEKEKDLALQALSVLHNHPLIDYAEPNYLQYVDQTPNDPNFSQLWGLNNTGQTGGINDADIDAPEAWNISTGSSEIIVGVIDTGIDYDHKDLAANIWSNPEEIPGNGIDDDANGYVDDVHGINSITGTGDPMDDHYHGTHCSGTIGAVGNNTIGVVGVNWMVKLIGLKFLDSGGSGWTDDAIECINYAVALKNRGVNIRVLNNSWGGGGYSQALIDAIDVANNAGILFVAAAGNSSLNNDIIPHYPSSYMNDNILSVASIDHNDELSYFSNYGPESVDLGAPGSSILSTFPDNSYSTLSGTSMATPHVSGAAALLLSVNDQLSVQQLKSLLMDYGESGLDGMCVSNAKLNVYNSLSRVEPPTPTFRLSSDTLPQSINQGGSASYDINIVSVSGFTGSVNLSTSSEPAINATIEFDPNPCTPDISSNMTVSTSTETEPGDYVITVTGDSGFITKTTSVALKVNPKDLVPVSYSNYPNPVIPIPDNKRNGVKSFIDVPDSLTIWEISCEVNITHTYISDLVVKLISPSQTEVVLHNREGGWTHDIHQTYYPTEFRNENSEGAWTLFVSDNYKYDVGTLDSWTLTINGIPVGSVNQAPAVTITEPPNGAEYSYGDLVTFRGTAQDPEEGDKTSEIVWTSSIDGSIGTGSSITVYDLNTGDHTITATVTDSGGKSNSDDITVTIGSSADNKPPIAVFDFDITSLKVTFTDGSTDSDGTIVSWLWDFGDGTTSTVQNPRHRYDGSKEHYDVTLTVTDNDGAIVTTMPETVYVSK